MINEYSGGSCLGALTEISIPLSSIGHLIGSRSASNVDESSVKTRRDCEYPNRALMGSVERYNGWWKVNFLLFRWTSHQWS